MFVCPAVLPTPPRIKPEFYENTGFMRSAPSGAATPRTRPRAPAQAAPTGTLRSSESRLSRLVRTAPFTLRHPAQKTEHVFMRSFVEDSSHARRLPALRGPLRASHKNEFCLLRPPGARPALSALRLNQHPPIPPQSCGGLGRAGTGCGGSHPRTVPALRGRRVRGDHLTAQELRGGFAPTAQPRRAAAP